MSKEMIELADELARCDAYPMAGLPGALKFIAGFAMTEAKRDLIVAALRAEPAPVEVWHADRKVTVYSDRVLRVWGTNIDTEMSDEPRTHEAVNAAFDWLYAHPAPAAPVPASVREALEMARKRIAYLSEYCHSRHADANEQHFYPEIDAAILALKSAPAK